MTTRFQPRWIAHRGGQPENSLTALMLSLLSESPADGIEFDVQLTSDSVPVIFHDHETDRLTGASGTIVERTWNEVSQLRSLGEPIARLSDLGDAIAKLGPGKRHINVEFKPTAFALDLIEASTPFFERMSAMPGTEVVLSSFDPRVVDAVIRKRPNWCVAYLYEDLAALDALKYFPPPSTPLDLHPKHNLLTEDHLEEYGQGQTTFRTWTVDDRVEACRILELGVRDIITNKPNDLAKEFEERASP